MSRNIASGLLSHAYHVTWLEIDPAPHLMNVISYQLLYMILIEAKEILNAKLGTLQQTAFVVK